jgi:channel protein (hemolysin III family)
LYGRSKLEEVANGLVHLPFVFVPVYYIFSENSNSVFFICSLLTFTMSILYHFERDEHTKKIFRRCDVASIFWLIPSTVFHLLPVWLGSLLLGLCVLLSVPVIKSETSVIFTDVALIIMAAACTILGCLFSSNWMTLVIGTLIYMLGLPFYFSSYTKWAHFVWHIFVALGWSTHAMLYL